MNIRYIHIRILPFIIWIGRSAQHPGTGMSVLMKLAVAILTLVIAACDAHVQGENNPIVSLHRQLGGDATGYSRACGPREFNFPDDHAAHPDFRNEWWYVTGNLRSTENVDFGFHATFFRIATSAPTELAEAAVTLETNASKWSTTQFYMGHFAISEGGKPNLQAHERFARAAAGLAGASQDKAGTKIWLDDWQLRHLPGQHSDSWTLQLKDDGDALQLSMTAEKPIVLQGIDGYSQKSSDPCNASYYYSLPRMAATGIVETAGQTHQVTGTAWLDREWSSSALADDQVGWDWFALQLNDGREIMFYRLRKRDGTVDPQSHAVLIERDGSKRSLELPQYTVEQWWKSPSGARYPISGRLTFSAADYNDTIIVEPLLDNQELNLTVRYWEGAIKLSDINGLSLGKGYLELTGY